MHIPTNTSLRLIGLFLLSYGSSPLLAQTDDAAGIFLGEGSTFTLGEGAVVTAPQGDVYVAEGATLVNHGDLTVGQDLIVDGSLQTMLRGDDDGARHGRITVHGEAEYRGSLVVAKARGSNFTKKQDFVLATYTTGFGTLAARELPGAAWTSEHRESELVVSLTDREADAEKSFAIELDAALLDDRVLVDWVVHFDDRSTNYVVERFDLVNGWADLGEIPGLAEEAETAYFSSIDNDIPSSQQVIRYRVRLEDESGMWNYSKEVLVPVGDEQELRVFPNPATGQFVQLIGVDQQRELASLRLISEQGQILRDYPIASQDLHVLELPTDILGAVHFIQVAYVDGSRQSCQVVVVR